MNREEASKIGAFLAQAEMGDSLEDESRDHHMLCYPQYFNDWDVGIARAISQEHTQIKGQSLHKSNTCIHTTCLSASHGTCVGTLCMQSVCVALKSA